MRRSVTTLGTFDGVHRGHQAILKKVVERAARWRARSVVLAFGMPPRHAGEPRREPVLLTTLSEKIDIIRQMGLDHVEVLVFDRKTASTPPERFFRQTILRKFRSTEMIVGPRLAFGKDRAGRLPLLRALGRHYGVRIRVVQPIQGVGADISSRRIRALLRRGNVDTANRLLGYPFSAAGKVVHGDGRGRHIGYPTANIDVPRDKILPRGVFWVKVVKAAGKVPLTASALGRAMDGLCNVGTRPTFTPKSHQLRCEVFLLNRPRRPARMAPLYGENLRVVFMRKIRAERRFASAQALSSQIQKDVSVARNWIRRSSKG